MFVWCVLYVWSAWISVKNKLPQREMMSKGNRATDAMATTLADVFWQEGSPVFSHLRVFLPNSSLSSCLYLPSFPRLLPDRRTAAIVTANEGQGYLCVCLVCQSLRGKRHRECLCMSVCVPALGCLEGCKARSWKRKSEKDKGRCALQLSSLDLFPLCY